MNRFFEILVMAACVVSCGKSLEVKVSNHSLFDRTEVVEVEASAVESFGGGFAVKDAEGNAIPWQLTHDGKLLFLSCVKAGASSIYKITGGKPAAFDTLCTGNIRPDRLDDYIWENDKSGYRTYGPALRASGEMAYGYDVFTKSVSYPVMDDRLDKALKQGISYHEDHGDGMDAYGVGATLGCGADALADSRGNIVYPWCWATCEILDRGPLRVTARLSYTPFEIDGKTIVETRTITLDAGSHFNRSSVSFAGLDGAKELVVGLVIHPENPAAYRFGKDSSGGWAAYPDLGDANVGENGEIYVGAVVASPVESVSYVPFKDDIAGNHSALGHVLIRTEYTPGEIFSYWFGSGWSKAGIKDMDEWERIVKEQKEKVTNKLIIDIK